MQNEFWTLVEEYQIQIPDLSLICNAPLKILRIWSEEGAPDDALQSLKRFLGIDSDRIPPETT